ncbi:Gpi16 subunit, GPI transamidase component, partial [Ancylostoma caninum]
LLSLIYELLLRCCIWNSGPRHILFPRILAEIISAHSIAELSFHLTQGRWYSSRWGLPPQPSGSTGATVHAWIYGNETTVDGRWRTLINALNGVFCTALTSIVPELTSSPKLAFRPFRSATDREMQLRYSAVGRETVCTENLTPWKKLLPCKQHGLVTLFNPIKLYENVYHSIGLQLHPACEAAKCRWFLQLVMYNVVDIPVNNKKLDWSIFELFGRKASGVCNAATTSRILVEIDDKNMRLEPAPLEIIKDAQTSFAVYDLHKIQSEPSFSVSALYNGPLSSTSKQSPVPISVSSVVGGTDQLSGLLVSVLRNEGAAQQVIYTHQLPWFLLIYYHTVTLTCKDLSTAQKQIPTIHKQFFAPAVTRKRPALIEWEFNLPENSECRLHFQFEKAFLRIREYPPDANHGMYVPGAILTLLPNETDNRDATGENRAVVHGNVLLIALPVPDFSMPFNVICFVMTTVSLCFGPIHSFSTKMLIPVNSVLPSSSLARKVFRLFLLVLLALASYAQYKEMSLHEIRRSIEQFFEKMNSV